MSVMMRTKVSALEGSRKLKKKNTFCQMRASSFLKSIAAPSLGTQKLMKFLPSFASSLCSERVGRNKILGTSTLLRKPNPKHFPLPMPSIKCLSEEALSLTGAKCGVMLPHNIYPRLQPNPHLVSFSGTLEDENLYPFQAFLLSSLILH